MRRAWFACTLACFALLFAASNRADYVDDLRRVLQRSFGDRAEFQNYEFYGSPVGNFGVGTMFTGDVRRRRVTTVERAWLVGDPATWWAESMRGDEKKSEREALLREIFVQGSMGTITVDQSSLRDISAQSALALLKRIIPATFHASNDVHVTVTKATAMNRRMNWDVFYEAVREGKIKQSIQRRVDAATPNFVIVAADIVLTSYHATVAVNPAKDGELYRTLVDLAVQFPMTAKNIASLKVQKTDSGTFEVGAEEPIVIARMLLAPPREGELGGSGSPRPLAEQFRGWSMVKVPNDVLARLARKRG